MVIVDPIPVTGGYLAGTYTIYLTDGSRVQVLAATSITAKTLRETFAVTYTVGNVRAFGLIRVR